jgi:hypothetical protein
LYVGAKPNLALLIVDDPSAPAKGSKANSVFPSIEADGLSPPLTVDLALPDSRHGTNQTCELSERAALLALEDRLERASCGSRSVAMSFRVAAGLIS